MIAFDITRTLPDGRIQNIFTSIKTDADNFLFESVFLPEVKLDYKKFKISSLTFRKELSNRYKRENKGLLQ